MCAIVWNTCSNYGKYEIFKKKKMWGMKTENAERSTRKEEREWRGQEEGESCQRGAEEGEEGGGLPEPRGPGFPFLC